MRKSALQERTGQLDWEALRTVLAIAREGSLSGAARRLGVQHSSVFRRLNQIEQRLGLKLFERSRSGYLANAEGEVVMAAALQMEHLAIEAERKVLGRDSRLSGSIRIASSELLATFALAESLRAFSADHPEIEIELVVGNRPADLERREADLAIRATPVPPETLIARQMASVDYAIFASRDQARHTWTFEQARSARWIGLTEDLSHLQIAQWQLKHLAGAFYGLRTDSLAALSAACEQGMGLAVMPRFAISPSAGIAAICLPLDHPRMPVWLLTHPDTRNNARVRALVQHLSETLPEIIRQQSERSPQAEHRFVAPAGI